MASQIFFIIIIIILNKRNSLENNKAQQLKILYFCSNCVRWVDLRICDYVIYLFTA